MSVHGEVQEATTAALSLVPPVADPSSRIRIVGEREGGLLECYVPLDLINTEDVAVNEEHVAELVRSIQYEQEHSNGSGQLTPILLGHVEGEEKYRVIDGFHRAKSLQIAKVEYAYATIRESTREDVIDLRILTARMHKSVRFARVIEWVNDAWQETPWRDQISVTQAFVLHNNSSSGTQLGVDKDAAAIKTWVKEKCDQWQISPATVYGNLSLASIADPSLVQEARASTGGRSLPYLTPGHLRVIASQLPGKFDMQRLIAGEITRRNLRIPAARRIARVVIGARNVREAAQMLNDVDWQKLEPETAAELVAPRPEVTVPPLPQGGAEALHTGTGGILMPIDVALSRAAMVVTETARKGEADSVRNYLVAARNELLQLGQRAIGLAGQIDSTIARPRPNVPKPAATPVKVPAPKVPAVEPTVGPERPSAPAYETNTVFHNSLTEFVRGRGEMPEIISRSDILRAERIIKSPPVGASFELVEDLREEVRTAREALQHRL